MFPFSATPLWAQRVGELLPMTHYLRITCGVMLRGDDSGSLEAQALPIAAFAVLQDHGDPKYGWAKSWSQRLDDLG